MLASARKRVTVEATAAQRAGQPGGFRQGTNVAMTGPGLPQRATWRVPSWKKSGEHGSLLLGSLGWELETPAYEGVLPP